MSDLEKVKEKVKKLLSMNMDNGASESESEFALKKASELMAEYNFTEKDLHTLSKNDVLVEFIPCRKYAKSIIGKAYLSALMVFCDARGFKSSSQDGIYVYALPKDMEIFKYLKEVIDREVLKALYDFQDYVKENPTSIHGKTRAASYLAGIDANLYTRIMDMKKEQVDSATGKELVICKHQLITEAMANIKIKNTGGAPQRVNKSAYEAGKERGASISFHTGIRSDVTTGAGITQTRQIGRS